MLKCFEIYCHKLGQIVPFFLHSAHLDQAQELVHKIQSWVDEVAPIAEQIPAIAPEAAAVNAVVDEAGKLASEVNANG